MGPAIHGVALALAITCSAAAGCTQLDVLGPGDPEGLPYADRVPRWHDPDDSTSISVAGGRWRLTSDLPRLATPCVDCPHVDDLDLDGLRDAWEIMVLDVLRPELRFGDHEDLFADRAARLGSLGRVTPGEDAEVLVFILFVYSRDYGRCTFTEHAGDVERVVLRLRPRPDDAPGSIDIIEIHAGAHEYTSVDHSTTEAPGALTFWPDERTGWPRWVLFPAEGKHALYVAPRACDDFADGWCLAEGCPDGTRSATRELLVPVHDVGEPWSPRWLGRDGDEAWPWPFSVEQPWDPGPFCGDADPGIGVGCGADLAERLERDPFAPREGP